jgi:acetoin utilization protein AcuB
MNVSDVMTRKLITVTPDDSVEKAVQLFRQRGIRHLLVLKGQRLVGIVSDHDLMRTLEPLRAKRKKLLNVGGLFFLLEPVEVREIMSKDVVTIQPDHSLQYAAAMMVTSRYGALPVVADEEVVGIVTATDLLRYLAKLDLQPKQQRKARTVTRRGRNARGARTTRAL